jgi:hypothetical protein
MANIQPVFDTILPGSGTVQTDSWVDLGLIPSGKQIYIGFATYAAIDKNNQFELRFNNAGQSAGTMLATTLVDYASAVQGSSVDRDYYFGGAVATLTTIGDGTAHWWLRVLGQGNTVANFDYILRYTLY